MFPDFWGLEEWRAACTKWVMETLVGGKETDGDPAIVAIYVGPAQACSGSLIAKNKVLTAGHCVLDDALLTVPGVSIVFGKDADDLDAREIDVASWTKHPRFDVGMVTLDKEVTDVAPLALVEVPITDAAVGTIIRHSGYGESKEGDSFSKGIKHTASYAITKVDPFLIWSGGKDAQTCEGDSGSPALFKVDGVEKILGVVSDGPNCHEAGNDARVDVKEVHDWIVTTAGLASAVVAPAKTAEAPAPAPAPAPASPAASTTSSLEAPPQNTTADGCGVGGHSPIGVWLIVGAFVVIRSAARRRGCGARGAARARPCSARPS